jgi:uncharacterized protein (TIGR02246 family)
MRKPFFLFQIMAAGLLVTCLMSCETPTENAQETDPAPVFDLNTAKQEIIDANKAFAAAFAAGDSTGVANLYAQDAKFMMNGSPAIVGRDNIRSVISGIMKSGISSVELGTVGVWGTENLVTEEGTLVLMAGDAIADRGKYLVLWQKENGDWHLFRDIFNSNGPAQ